VKTQHTESAGIIPGNAFVPNTNRANKYAIRWTSTVSGTAGTGTKRFKQAEAEQLAAELNRDYPETEHEAVLFVSPPAETACVPA
jgi:hypothetical protein